MVRSRRRAGHAPAVPGAALTEQAEAYRVLRANLAVALSGVPFPTVLVTSSHPDEGKTSVAANLAVAMAADGWQVGLVDADLRRPNLHKWFGIANVSGVSDILLGRRSLATAAHQVKVSTGLGGMGGRLRLVTAGTAVEQPTELLGAGAMPALLEGVVERSAASVESTVGRSVVIVDSAPVLPVADALILGRMVSGAVLVAETRRTDARAVQQAKDALIRNQTRLLGVVLNSRSPERGTSGRYGYGHGYPDRRAAG